MDTMRATVASRLNAEASALRAAGNHVEASRLSAAAGRMFALAYAAENAAVSAEKSARNALPIVSCEDDDELTLA